ncbi:MAG: hypothetical protein ABIM46_06340 [candidate division WOR-3 bacterium]
MIGEQAPKAENWEQGIGVGDIILIRNTGLLPWLIRFWTRRGAPAGHEGYNHAAICVGRSDEALWLSAEPCGVGIRNTTELLKGAEGFVVLHFTGPIRIGFSAAQRAMATLRSGYDFVGVLGFVISRITGLRVDFRGKWFCSEICHSAWQEALVENGLLRSFRDSSDTSPNDLLAWALHQGCFEKIRVDREWVPGS